MKQAVILAGGKGTRLQERLNGLPKPLVDIAGKPLLEHQILLLKRFGYSEVLLLVNHRAEYIENYCASNNNWGIGIHCINEGVARGTAGAIFSAFDLLHEEFLVVYGDTMLEVDLQRFEEFHHSYPNADATLFVHPNDHPHDSDLVEINSTSLITAFHPYPHKEGSYFQNLVNAALYCLKRDALKPWKDTPGLLDFGKDIFPAMLGQWQILRAYNSPEYIKDCGTPKRLDKVTSDYVSGRIERSGLYRKQKAVFIDRDGVINKEVSHLNSPQQFELLPNVGKAIKRLTDSEFRTVVVTNQPVVARGECSPEALQEIHNKMESLLGQEGAYVDRIYYCPHHPDKGFEGEVTELKIQCDCRKPNIGMVKQASTELNIDTAESWIVGDTSVDMLTGERAGLHSILVETGYAGLDGRYGVVPNFIVPDLNAAAAFILDDFPKLIALCEKIGKQVNTRDFVFIGGLSRSGKSNFAGCLRHSLNHNGKRAVILQIDRWLHNEVDRGDGVEGRYNTKELADILSVLTKRKEAIVLELPIYDKLNRRVSISGSRLQIEPDDIVIVEGTIALLFADNLGVQNSHKWFVEIDENQRSERVLKEYRLRGFSDEEAQSILITRQQDELPFIMKSAEKASIRVALHIGEVTAPQITFQQQNSL